MLGLSTLACALCTAMLGHGGLIVALIVFALAIALNGCGLIFYDALLPVVSTPVNRGRISGYGVGAGFGGAVLGVLVGAIILSTNSDTKPTVFKVSPPRCSSSERFPASCGYGSRPGEITRLGHRSRTTSA